jgi:hypothetical protein
MASEYEKMVQGFQAKANARARQYMKLPYDLNAPQDLGNPFTNGRCWDYHNDVKPSWLRGMSNGKDGPESAETKPGFDHSQARLSSVPRSGRRSYGYENAAGTPPALGKGRRAR